MEGLRTLAAELGIENDVFFIGRCDNVANLLFASDIGVLRSKAEGFPNAILEYMAGGLPGVATDVGGARAGIGEDETGYVRPSRYAQTIAPRTTCLLHSP